MRRSFFDESSFISVKSSELFETIFFNEFIFSLTSGLSLLSNDKLAFLYKLSRVLSILSIIRLLFSILLLRVDIVDFMEFISK